MEQKTPNERNEEVETNELNRTNAMRLLDLIRYKLSKKAVTLLQAHHDSFIIEVNSPEYTNKFEDILREYGDIKLYRDMLGIRHLMIQVLVGAILMIQKREVTWERDWYWVNKRVSIDNEVTFSYETICEMLQLDKDMIRKLINKIAAAAPVVHIVL